MNTTQITNDLHELTGESFAAVQSEHYTYTVNHYEGDFSEFGYLQNFNDYYFFDVAKYDNETTECTEFVSLYMEKTEYDSTVKLGVGFELIINRIITNALDIVEQGKLITPFKRIV